MSDSTTLVCMLCVGDAEPISSLAFRSIRRNYSGSILIGYVNEADVSFAKHDGQVQFVDLSSKLYISGGEYRGFQDPVFYQIVKLKWELLLCALDMDYENVIYSDLDVLWLRNAAETIKETFRKFTSVEVLIQSFTRGSELPCLCMGFVAFRAGNRMKEFIELCKSTHIDMAKTNQMLGDDEVISKVFQDMNYPGWIRELPQSTFPTGNLYPLFLKHFKFRKMAGINPYILHLNFVVGIENKILLLKYLNISSFLALESIKPQIIIHVVKRLMRKRFLRRRKFTSNS